MTSPDTNCPECGNEPHAQRASTREVRYECGCGHIWEVQPGRRAASCKDRPAFAQLKYARKAAWAHQRNTGQLSLAYKCPHCGLFHFQRLLQDPRSA